MQNSCPVMSLLTAICILRDWLSTARVPSQTPSIADGILAGTNSLRVKLSGVGLLIQHHNFRPHSSLVERILHEAGENL